MFARRKAKVSWIHPPPQEKKTEKMNYKRPCEQQLRIVMWAASLAADPSNISCTFLMSSRLADLKRDS